MNMIKRKIDFVLVFLLAAVFIWRTVVNRVEIEAKQFYPMKFVLVSFPCYQ